MLPPRGRASGSRMEGDAGKWRGGWGASWGVEKWRCVPVGLWWVAAEVRVRFEGIGVGHKSCPERNTTCGSVLSGPLRSLTEIGRLFFSSARPSTVQERERHCSHAPRDTGRTVWRTRPRRKMPSEKTRHHGQRTGSLPRRFLLHQHLSVRVNRLQHRRAMLRLMNHSGRALIFVPLSAPRRLRQDAPRLSSKMSRSHQASV